MHGTGMSEVESTTGLIEQMSSIASASAKLVSSSNAQTRSAEEIARDLADVREVARQHSATRDAIVTQLRISTDGA